MSTYITKFQRQSAISRVDSIANELIHSINSKGKNVTASIAYVRKHQAQVADYFTYTPVPSFLVELSKFELNMCNDLNIAYQRIISPTVGQ